jgi:hypothetical protein
MRNTFGSLRLSNYPQAIGACKDDLPVIAASVNEVEQILINAGGETGFWGCWAKIQFIISRANPYWTLSPQFARIINAAVCTTGIRIQNEFYEVLEAGIGLKPDSPCQTCCPPMEAYDRGGFSTQVDLPVSNQFLRLYAADPADIQAGKRLLIHGALDQNGNAIYSTDGLNQVSGVYLTATSPFATTSMIVTKFDGIQKDPTVGDFTLSAVDATTGNETILSRYGATEQLPNYRRYFFNGLPDSCCASNLPNIAITALAKYEFSPVSRDTDFLIIGNIPALTRMAMSVRYSRMDSPNAPALEVKNYKMAIKMLNDELRHYLGEVQPAIHFAPWGTARLERQSIGTMI